MECFFVKLDKNAIVLSCDNHFLEFSLDDLKSDSVAVEAQVLRRLHLHIGSGHGITQVVNVEEVDTLSDETDCLERTLVFEISQVRN